jgi:hypothetical protein
MLHKQIQADILREEVPVSNRLIVLTKRTWINFDFDLSLIGVIGLGDEESWHRESILHNVLCIFNRSLK